MIRTGKTFRFPGPGSIVTGSATSLLFQERPHILVIVSWVLAT